MSAMNVIVIGGGVMGLSCAWRLAQAGAAVRLLEARECGQGATRAALGALWPSSPLVNGPLQNLHRASLWEFEPFIAELTQRTAMPVHFRRCGRLEFLNSGKLLVRAVEEASVATGDWPPYGTPLPVMELLDPAQIAALFPALETAGRAALLCRATAQVNVPELVGALRAACQMAGVSIHENTPVTAIQRQGQRITGVRAGNQAFEAEALLVTAGAWSPGLAPEIAQAAPIRPVKGQGLALAPPPGFQLDTIIKSDSIYLVPWMNNAPAEILVGSTTEPDADFDESPTTEARDFLLAGAIALIPALKNARILRQWTGLRPQNPAKRHPPIMGPHPAIPNLYICTGHFKTGLGLAPIVSRMMAGTIAQDALAPELAEFNPR